MEGSNVAVSATEGAHCERPIGRALPEVNGLPGVNGGIRALESGRTAAERSNYVLRYIDHVAGLGFVLQPRARGLSVAAPVDSFVTIEKEADEGGYGGHEPTQIFHKLLLDRFNEALGEAAEVGRSSPRWASGVDSWVGPPRSEDELSEAVEAAATATSEQVSAACGGGGGFEPTLSERLSREASSLGCEWSSGVYHARERLVCELSDRLLVGLLSELL